MKSFILPINLQPPITLYEHHASPLAIMSTKDDYKGWLFSNFIQLWCSKDLPTNRAVAINYCDDGDDYYLKYFMCPFLYTYIVPNKYMTSESKSIVEFFKEALIDGHYIRTYLDVFYLPDNSYYLTTHYVGAKLIYGFNDESQTFLTIGYRDGHYIKSEINYDLLEKAFHANPNEVDWQSQILLDRYIPGSYSLDIRRISNLIYDYTNSMQRTLYKSNWKDYECYGIKTYKYIYEYFVALENGQTEFDIRPCHIIWEHKNIMLQRLQLLIKEGYLEFNEIEQFELLVNHSLQVRNYFLKYNITKNKNIINKVVNEIQKIEKKELELMKIVNSQLSKYI